MSNLFKLKRWMVIADAAKRLSVTFGEDVSEADVFRLALDGHLKLSIHLVNGAPARSCTLVKPEDIKWIEIPSLDGIKVVRVPADGRIFSHEHSVFQVEHSITTLNEEIWDLPMIGGERIDVEYAYQQITNGPEVTAVSLDGVFVASEKGHLYEIQSYSEPKSIAKSPNLKVSKYSPDKYHPAGSLPEDSIFVVRTDALRALEQSMTEVPAVMERPLINKERHTLLTIIAVLCKEAKLDHSKHAKTAALILNTAASMGVSISETAIENHLKKIPDALATRMK